MCKGIEWADFFSFLTKIFHNIYLPCLCFENNNNKRHCLSSMSKVSNNIKFKREAFGEFVAIGKKNSVNFCEEKFYV